MSLQVKIIQGQDLVVADVGGSSDPFVKLLVPGRKDMFKTKVIKKCLNPKWDETFFVPNMSSSNTIKFEVYDWDRFSSNDPLGNCSVTLSDLIKGKPTEKWLTLDAVASGKIQVCLTATDFGLSEEQEQQKQAQQQQQQSPPQQHQQSPPQQHQQQQQQQQQGFPSGGFPAQGYPPPQGYYQYPPQAYPPPQEGYPSQGFPPQSYPPPQEGYPSQGFPPQSYPPPQEGYPPQSYPPPQQGYPPQGYYPPPQGYPPVEGGYNSQGFSPQGYYSPPQDGTSSPSQTHDSESARSAGGSGITVNVDSPKLKKKGSSVKLPSGKATKKASIKVGKGLWSATKVAASLTGSILEFAGDD